MMIKYMIHIQIDEHTICVILIWGLISRGKSFVKQAKMYNLLCLSYWGIIHYTVS